MFIREVKKQRSNGAKAFYQYNLVQSTRLDNKSRQQVLLYLGSDPLLRDKVKRNLVCEMLKSKIFKQEALFPPTDDAELMALAQTYYEKFLLKYGDGPSDAVSIPPRPDTTVFEQVDMEGIEVTDVRSFGAEHLCGQVLEKLGIAPCLKSLGFDNEQVTKSIIAISARALFASSEHRTAQILGTNSALAECLRWQSPITHKQLYAVADQLYAHRDAIDRHLHRRVTDWFNLEDKLVIFDISNTYFETGKTSSDLARYGRSKEKRTDCPLVVFTAVVNAEGFLRHSRIYEGNKPDTATLADMLADLERQAGAASKKTVVMDAGIATEDNLELLREKGYRYVCVSRKQVKDYPADLSDSVVRLTDRDENQVRLKVFTPEGQPDTWMYVQSDAKGKKEKSMDDKLSRFFEQQLQAVKDALSKKGGTKKVEKVWERIGRVKQKNARVSPRYLVNVEQAEGIATDVTWSRKEEPAREEKNKGAYFIRTNYENPSEGELWDVYNTIREVEATFRCLKSELNIRPVHHQNDGRIASHIYLTVLAYQLVNTIRHMLKQQGIRHSWKNILRIMSTQTIQTIEVPTDKKTVHLRKPAKPIQAVQEIYRATACTHTQTALKKYVVYH
jgi:transposase